MTTDADLRALAPALFQKFLAGRPVTDHEGNETACVYNDCRAELRALLSEVRERREGERRQADEGARYWAETKALTHSAAVAVSEGARASGVTFIGREDEPLGLCDMPRGGSKPHPRSFCCDNWRPAPAAGSPDTRTAPPTPTDPETAP